MSLQTISSIYSKMGKSHTKKDINRVIRSIHGDVAKWPIVSLIEELKQNYWGLRREVARALGEMGSDVEVAVVPLIEALKDRDNYTRKIISYALYRIGKPAIPILIEAISNNRGRARKSAACALGYIGSNAKAAVPALVGALMEEDHLSSIQITYTLAKILSPREQRVLRLRLGLEGGRIWTLQEVGKELGITGERVR